MSYLIDLVLHHVTLISDFTFHGQWNVSKNFINRGFECARVTSFLPELLPLP